MPLTFATGPTNYSDREREEYHTETTVVVDGHIDYIERQYLMAGQNQDSRMKLFFFFAGRGGNWRCLRNSQTLNPKH